MQKNYLEKKETSYRGVLRPLSIAPMMDRTDRHFRFFLRQITRHTLLYTEMITCPAIQHGDRERILGFSVEEKPLSLQLGGDDPLQLAACAKIAEDMGYDEVNLNVGCPSSRVQNGRFGACLMANPERVANCVHAMRSAVQIPVTVKHRIGIDKQDKYEDLTNFVSVVSQANCDRFSIHARAAWLKGLSPKENREIPPLRYNDVYRLKQDFPHLIIEINGGITTFSSAKEHLVFVDAVMLGRAAYELPYQFVSADKEFFGDKFAPQKTRQEIIESMIPYVERWRARGSRLHSISRHLLTLFAGQRGARSWRRFLSQNSPRQDAGPEVLLQALKQIPENPPL